MSITPAALVRHIVFPIALLLLIPAHALAESPCAKLDAAQAKQYLSFVQAGHGAAKAQEYDLAIKNYRLAMDICPYDPAIIYSFARVQDLKGDCTAAIPLYQQAIAQLKSGLVETALTIDQVQTKLTEAERVCSTLANVSITCADEGTVIELTTTDAKGATVIPKGFETPQACPLDNMTLNAGTYTLVASRADFPPYRDEVVVEPGRAQSVRVPTFEQPEAPASDLAPWAWTSIGIGGALVTTGIVMTVLASSERSAVTDAATDANGNITGLTQADAVDKQDTANTFDTVGVITLSVGGAAVITGVVLLLLDDTGESDTQIQSAILPEGGATLGFSTRF